MNTPIDLSILRRDRYLEELERDICMARRHISLSVAASAFDALAPLWHEVRAMESEADARRQSIRNLLESSEPLGEQ